MTLFVLRTLILQTRMRSHPVLAWAFAGRLCDKYHNLISWLISRGYEVQVEKLVYHGTHHIGDQRMLKQVGFLKKPSLAVYNF